ncbi:MAG: A/G-specific adenine glycosylase [Chloracidobacterium sp.]
MTLEVARRHLLAWFDGHRRSLPWRATTDAYRLWVAETLAQQTQAARAAEYYLRFIARFPTVQALAAAELAEVLKHWEGLGYYRRAQRLHAAARHICAHGQGRLPRSAAEWRRLPGVGDYTAAAVASVAFGEAVPAIDGNVRRVLARYRAADIGASLARQSSVVQATAQALVDGARPGDINQALMELGALVCRPRAPKCAVCPLAVDCAARRQGVATDYPLKPPRKARPIRPFACLLVMWQGRRLVVRRDETELLSGLWEFPTIPCRDGEDYQAAAARGLHALGLVGPPPVAGPVVTHDFTHFRQALQVFFVEVDAPGDLPQTATCWATPEMLAALPLTRLARRLADWTAPAAAPRRDLGS